MIRLFRRLFTDDKNKKNIQLSGLNSLSGRKTTGEAVNPKRRRERAEMKALGFKTKKAYRKWQKKKRHES